MNYSRHSNLIHQQARRSICASWIAFLLLLALEVNIKAAITMEVVLVGDPGNASYTVGQEPWAPPTVGGVTNLYYIGKYEVTSAQYTTFLNSVARTDTYGLYSTYMADPAAWYGCNIQRSGVPNNYTYSVAPDWAQRPVNYVSFWDAARFVNWMHNGQPIGPQNAATTEDGAYTLNGYTNSDGRSIRRNLGAKWSLPLDDEWFKAAFYKGGGRNAGYWMFPTLSDAIPVGELPPGHNEPPGSANYEVRPGPLDPIHHTTEVGAYSGSPSYFGTFDQAGNVSEWVETVYLGSYRGFRGGDWASGGGNLGPETSLQAIWPDRKSYNIGFRVVSSQPPTVLALSPQSQTAETGYTVSFTATASGDPPLLYQWFFNATNLFGAATTNSGLRLTNVQPAQAGTFTVVVTNPFGAATSAPTVLSVITPVERRPVPALTLAGQTGVSLHLEYRSTLDITANWLVLDNVTLTSPPQFYFDLTAPVPPQRAYRARQIGTPSLMPSLALNIVPALSLSGNIGDRVRVDAINQLGPIDAWFTLDTVTLTNTSQLYFDVSALGQPRRLYRLLQVP